MCLLGMGALVGIGVMDAFRVVHVVQYWWVGVSSVPSSFGDAVAAWCAPHPFCCVVCAAVLWGFPMSTLIGACGVCSWRSGEEVVLG